MPGLATGSLFGGCKNAMKLYPKVSDGEKVNYHDFTNFYPPVNSQMVSNGSPRDYP